jgi:hypothetical protein
MLRKTTPTKTKYRDLFPSSDTSSNIISALLEPTWDGETDPECPFGPPMNLSGGAVCCVVVLLANRPPPHADCDCPMSCEVLCYSYARVKMTVSSRVDGCYSVTSVRSGSPRLVMKSCICCGSVMDGSRHESAMNCLLNLSMKPDRCSMASAPSGLSVSGGLNRALTNWTNYVQVGRPSLSSIRWNQSWASSKR